MIGVGYEFATIVSQLLLRLCIEAVLLLDLPRLFGSSLKLESFQVD